MVRVWIVVSCCCLGCWVGWGFTAAHAQFGSSYEQQAYGHFTRGEYAQALQAYTRAAQQDSSSFPVWLGMGMCLKQLGKQQAALAPFWRAYLLDSARTPALYLYLGDAYMFNLNYPRAVWAYERFLRVAGEFRAEKELARTNLRKARWAAQHLADSIDFRPQNLGAAINSPFEDFNAFLTADDSLLLFNSYRPLAAGRPQISNFYISTRTDTGWSAAKALPAPVNSSLHEKEFHWSADGQTLLFGRHATTTEGGRVRCSLWQTHRHATEWAEPQLLPSHMQSEDCDSWPTVSADGQTLYFVSNRPGGFGGYDIWYAQRLPTGEWGEPANLGSRINTPGNEFDVFVHPDDHTLYFTSDYHEGFGGYDIFLCRLQPDGHWGTPQNLGYPLNTPWDEFDMFVNTQGTQGYLNSDRFGGYGDQDLYVFDLDARIRPIATRWLKGRVRDASKPNSFPDATLWLLDTEQGDTIRQIPVLPQQKGHFLTAVRQGRNYAFLAIAQGYLPHSIHFSGADSRPGTWLTLALKPLSIGAEVPLRNCFFDTGSARLRPESLAELRVLSGYLMQQPSLRVEVAGHTDNQGLATDNLTLSHARAQAVVQQLLAFGVPLSQLHPQGYGQEQPLVPNDTPANRQQNRRVSLKVLAY